MVRKLHITDFQPFFEFKRNPLQVIADDLNRKKEDDISAQEVRLGREIIQRFIQ